MARLLINRGSFRVNEIDLKHGTLTIGREAGNDIPVQDTAVSGHHAKIVTLFDASYVQDLGSTNGTFVNGKRVQEHTLRNGDVITVGNHQILFESDAQAATDPTTSDHTMVMSRQELDRLIAARDNTFVADRVQPPPAAARGSKPAPRSSGTAPTAASIPPPLKSTPNPTREPPTVRPQRPQARTASTRPVTPQPATDRTAAATAGAASNTAAELPAGPSAWPLWLILIAAIIVAGALVALAILLD